MYHSVLSQEEEKTFQVFQKEEEKLKIFPSDFLLSQ